MKIRYYSLWLCLICIIVFLFQTVFLAFTDFFVLDSSLVFKEPWRLLTSIFLHGSIGHLLYNVFALALFGFILEKIVGSRNFLIVFFVSGLIASAASSFVYESALGASGAIFGVIGAIVILRPLMVVWTFSLPMPMFVAAILWVIGDLIGLLFPSNVANLAHLAGLFCGLLFGLISRFLKSGSKNRKIFLGEHNYIPEKYVLNWEDKYMKN